MLRAEAANIVRLEMETLSTLDFPDKGAAYKPLPCVMLWADLAHITQGQWCTLSTLGVPQAFTTVLCTMLWADLANIIHGEWCTCRMQFWAEPASITPLQLWPDLANWAASASITPLFL